MNIKHKRYTDVKREFKKVENVLTWKEKEEDWRRNDELKTTLNIFRDYSL